MMPDERHEPTIVVGVDGSAAGRVALAWAADEAAMREARVIALHAWEPVLTSGATRGAYYRPEQGDAIAEAVLDEALDGLELPAGVVVDRRAVRGDPSHALHEASEGADLVVVGSRRRGALDRIVLGSVSTKVVHHARCPVVVVPTER